MNAQIRPDTGMNRYKLARKDSPTRLTQEFAAIKLGISPSTLKRYENGDIDPDVDMVHAMAELYDNPNLIIDPSQPAVVFAHLHKYIQDACRIMDQAAAVMYDNKINSNEREIMDGVVKPAFANLGDVCRVVELV